ncbi:MAG: reverse transcriptase/maturase family protein [Patescibacteria group bacterium]|nr:reverse transcriptase/maturase family protein [Patescibacteria group bacterium]
MAKTYKNLFSKIVSIENLMSAYNNATKQKRFRDAVLLFDQNLSKNIGQLHQQLISKTYKHGQYHFFTVYDKKKRTISAAPFRDRVVHHAIYKIIEPIYNKKFIFDSYANRKLKGSHRAVKRLQKFLLMAKRRASGQTTPLVYCLKCDISKCFPSINHKILIKILNKKIKDKDTIWLLREIINSYESGNEYNKLFPANSYFHAKRPRGIAIGNLTSQIFVNIYLNELDQYLKHQLKVKYYVRYVDDFIILSKDKKYLHQLVKKIKAFLYDNLYLTLHPKKISISPSALGINFLGYIVFKDFILLLPQNKRLFYKKLHKLKKLFQQGKICPDYLQRSLTAWLAYCEHADSYRLRKRIFGQPINCKEQKKLCYIIYSWLDHTSSCRFH